MLSESQTPKCSPEKIGPPTVAPEDSRPPAPGRGRQVRCHQCYGWEAWQWVTEKGAIEGDPVAGDLECWRCYIQRTNTNLTWGDVKPLFKNLTVKKRNHRVQCWQDMLSYVVGSLAEVEGSKVKLKGQKRAFDVANGERIGFETSGGGSSSTMRLDTDEDVEFRSGDQYVGTSGCFKSGQ